MIKSWNVHQSQIYLKGISMVTLSCYFFLNSQIYKWLTYCLVLNKHSTMLNVTGLSFAKWLSVRLRTKWLWVRVPLQSLKPQILHLFWAGVPWHSGKYRVWIGFSLKCVRDMIKTYRTMLLLSLKVKRNFSNCQMIHGV